jgi:hypothetical protein
LRNCGIGIGSSSPPFRALRTELIALRRKFVTVTPGTAWGYWNARKRPALRALVRLHVQHALAVEEDVPVRDLVGRVAHQRIGEGRLPGPRSGP